jgi:hypothetical protein
MLVADARKTNLAPLAERHGRANQNQRSGRRVGIKVRGSGR